MTLHLKLLNSSGGPTSEIREDTDEPKCFNLREEIPALGHDLQTVHGKEATCETPGLTDGSTCGRCDKTVTEQKPITPLGHDPVKVPGVMPDCVMPGVTEGQICGTCQKALSPPDNIPALGHRYEDGLCVTCGTRDPVLIPGDADGDGEVSYQDALIILRVSIELDPQKPIHLLLCDMDTDGILTYADALTILRASIGLTWRK